MCPHRRTSTTRRSRADAGRLRRSWREHGFDLDFAELVYTGRPRRGHRVPARPRLADHRRAHQRDLLVSYGLRRSRTARRTSATSSTSARQKARPRWHAPTPTAGTWRPASAPPRPWWPPRGRWPAGEPDPLINDPYAAPLVRAVGIDFFTRWSTATIAAARRATTDGAGIRLMTDVMAVRTRFFDDFFIDAAAAGVRQAVILAVRAGLARVPPAVAGRHRGLRDRPAPGDRGQDRGHGRAGRHPTAERRTVAIDLREDWPAALAGQRLRPGAPTAWSAEGLLMYLPPDAQDRLFDNITALSAHRQPGGHRIPRRRLRRRTGRAGQGHRRAPGRPTGSTSTSPSCSTPANATTSSSTSRGAAGTSRRATASTCSPTTVARSPSTTPVPLRNSVAVTAIRELGAA